MRRQGKGKRERIRLCNNAMAWKGKTHTQIISTKHSRTLATIKRIRVSITKVKMMRTHRWTQAPSLIDDATLRRPPCFRTKSLYRASITKHSRPEHHKTSCRDQLLSSQSKIRTTWLRSEKWIRGRLTNLTSSTRSSRCQTTRWIKTSRITSTIA